MIYTVTLNPSLDYHMNIKELRFEHVNRSAQELIMPGGKGVNVSVVLHNLGIENIATGFYAGYTGEQMKQLLQERGMQEAFVEVKKGMTRINVKLHANGDTEINGNGPTILPEDRKRLEEKLEKLNQNDLLVLSGSIPAGLSDTIYQEIMGKIAEKEVPVILDATGKILLYTLKEHPFLIKPNLDELRELFGVSVKTRPEVVFYAQKLQEMGAKNVMVSMAEEGAVFLTENREVYHAKVPVGIPKNSVGAGDSMIAGFLAGYVQNKDYKNAFFMGVCTGSASAFSKELATKEEVMRLMEANKDIVWQES